MAKNKGKVGFDQPKNEGSAEMFKHKTGSPVAPKAGKYKKTPSVAPKAGGKIKSMDGLLAFRKKKYGV